MCLCNASANADKSNYTHAPSDDKDSGETDDR